VARQPHLRTPRHRIRRPTQSRHMMYFANPVSNSAVKGAMASRVIGFIDTPLQGNKRIEGVTWCADNGCFNDESFDEQRWWDWLQHHAIDACHCLFAVAPDVLGDAEATLVRSLPWLTKIRELGYPAAYVLQDGSDACVPPWDEFDVLFVGGTTDFKLGPIARELVREAKKRGKHVHMGRVNSRRRYRYAEAIGCDSVDGTFLVFGPDRNWPRLRGWIEQPSLFDGEATA
jgi:hypothetical protein